MENVIQDKTGNKRKFRIAALFYFLIAFEFFYMATPFAVYFYSVYSPILKIISAGPFPWLSKMFLPHLVVETASPLLNMRNFIGAGLFFGGIILFLIGAGQVYYFKLTKRGGVFGGMYSKVRHPQYASLIISSFGLLILWPRYIMLLSFVAVTFVYYFLAKTEEKECIIKYGEKYKEYLKAAYMFFPIPFLPKTGKQFIPHGGLLRILTIILIYVSASVMSVLIGNVIRNWSINSINNYTAGKSVFVSVVKYNKEKLEKISNNVISSAEVDSILKAYDPGSEYTYINYLLPAEMYVSEIPMNPTFQEGMTHFMPQDYNGTSGKIVFTRAIGANNKRVDSREILLSANRIIPVLEVYFDEKDNRIIKIMPPAQKINYDGIPMPVF